MATDSSTPIVHGRCGCGARFRIRNAVAGVTVACPRCQRPITVTHADLRAAFFGTSLAPLQGDSGEAPEAKLVDVGELRIAIEGARPGLTGKVADWHDDALLLRALSGGYAGTLPSESMARPGAVAHSKLDLQQRSFLYDVLLSFVFAGAARNAQNVLLTSIGGSLVITIMLFLPVGFALFAIIPTLFLMLYLVHFSWSIVRHTANNEDEIPWIETDWTLWDDMIRPSLMILAVSCLCTIPCIVAAGFLSPTIPGRGVILFAAFCAGWFFWPIAILSLVMVDTWSSLRPDMLVRAILGIGPQYLVAWMAVSSVLLAWTLTYYYAWQLLFLPVAGVFLWFYLSYVTYRIIGLLFRHFRQRLPWGY